MSNLRAEQAKALINLPANTSGGTRDMTMYASQFSMGGGLDGIASQADAMLARPERTFLGNFGPAMPMAPAPLDAATNGMVLPRRSEYPVGYNLPTPPGATKLIDFRTLRSLGDLYDILRRCIEVRKQEVAQMNWEVIPKDPKAQDFDDRISAITAFFEKPDPIRGLFFDDWLKMLLEEVLVVDALSIYPHQTWLPGKGPLGSSLFALEVLDGTKIKPLVDVRGARPLPPAPAYQQFLYGVPRSELKADVAGGMVSPASNPDADMRQFAADQLVYRPYHPRSWTLYGFSNVEQIVINVNLALKRQQWWTAYFTDGSLPAGVVHVPEEWTASQVKEYEGLWNEIISGDVGWKHRVKAVPGALGFEQLKPPLGNENFMTFDSWLARITCIGMDVTADEIGLEPKSGLGGAGYGQSQENVTYRKSLRPLTSWVQAILSQVIATWFNSPDLQFRFIHDEAEDKLKKAQANQIMVNTGSKTPNEWRVEEGLDPYEDDLGNKPLIISRQGPVLLEDVNAVSKNTAGLNPDGSQKALPPAPGALVPVDGSATGAAQQQSSADGSDPTRDANTDTDGKMADVIVAGILKSLEPIDEEPKEMTALEAFKAGLEAAPRPPAPVVLVEAQPTPAPLPAPVVLVEAAQATPSADLSPIIAAIKERPAPPTAEEVAVAIRGALPEPTPAPAPALGDAEVLERNRDGNPTLIKRSDGRRRRIEYDRAGRLKAIRTQEEES